MSEQARDSRIKEERDNLLPLSEYKKLIHELKNGLSSIFLHAQLLVRSIEKPDPDTDAIKKSVDSIEKSVRAMVILLDSQATTRP